MKNINNALDIMDVICFYDSVVVELFLTYAQAYTTLVF